MNLKDTEAMDWVKECMHKRRRVTREIEKGDRRDVHVDGKNDGVIARGSEKRSKR